MVEEIWQELSKAKYIEWERLSRGRASQMDNLKCVKIYVRCSVSITGVYCSILVYLFVCHFFRVACKEALRSYSKLGNPDADEHEEQLNELEEVFRKAAKTDTPTDVRHFFIVLTFVTLILKTILFI